MEGHYLLRVDIDKLWQKINRGRVFILRNKVSVVQHL